MAKRHRIVPLALALLCLAPPCLCRGGEAAAKRPEAEDEQAARQLEELNRKLRERAEELLAAKKKLQAYATRNAELEQKLAALAARLATEEERRARLGMQVEQLRAGQQRVEQTVAALEKTMANVEKDLRARLQEMVQQNLARRRLPAPPQIPVQWQVKPYLGFDAQDLTADAAAQLGLGAKAGVLVTDVRPGGPAAVAGLQRNDVVHQFDGKEIRGFKDLKNVFAGKKAGEVAILAVHRGGRQVELKVKIGARKVRAGN